MSKIKLRDLISENYLQDEGNKKWTTEDKKSFLEEVGNFNSFNESIYKDTKYKDMSENIGGLLEKAENLLMSESDWFDGVTTKRDMKSMREAYKIFSKTCNEMDQLQERMSSAYESIGTALGKYYEIKDFDADEKSDDRSPEQPENVPQLEGPTYEEDDFVKESSESNFESVKFGSKISNNDKKILAGGMLRLIGGSTQHYPNGVIDSDDWFVSNIEVNFPKEFKSKVLALLKKLKIS